MRVNCARSPPTLPSLLPRHFPNLFSACRAAFSPGFSLAGSADHPVGIPCLPSFFRFPSFFLLDPTFLPSLSFLCFSPFAREMPRRFSWRLHTLGVLERRRVQWEQQRIVDSGTEHPLCFAFATDPSLPFAAIS